MASCRSARQSGGTRASAAAAFEAMLGPNERLCHSTASIAGNPSFRICRRIRAHKAPPAHNAGCTEGIAVAGRAAEARRTESASTTRKWRNALAPPFVPQTQPRPTYYPSPSKQRRYFNAKAADNFPIENSLPRALPDDLSDPPDPGPGYGPVPIPHWADAPPSAATSLCRGPRRPLRSGRCEAGPGADAPALGDQGDLPGRPLRHPQRRVHLGTPGRLAATVPLPTRTTWPSASARTTANKHPPRAMGPSRVWLLRRASLCAMPSAVSTALPRRRREDAAGPSSRPTHRDRPAASDAPGNYGHNALERCPSARPPGGASAWARPHGIEPGVKSNMVRARRTL